jgi:hypothetical protein
LRQLILGITTRFRQSNETKVSPSKFVNLAPTDAADEGGVYSEALLFAMEDPDVSNIALTGPYGSDKSSIIQSFLRKYRTLSKAGGRNQITATTFGGKLAWQSELSLS